MSPSDSNITRDDFVTWKYNLLASIRQKDAWLKFMTGGTHSCWSSQDDNPTRGLSATYIHPQDPLDPASIQNARDLTQNATVKLRGEHDDFLACLATFCPAGFYEFVIRESTSVQWIFDQILSTYNLQTKREDVLNGQEMNFTFNEKFTYQHAYIQLKDFYMSALLPAGTTWKGKVLQNAETLSPLAESLIIEKWLSKIHPNLPAHVKKTRGHLFTDRNPTLGCNQNEICKQIDIMLNEMEKESGSANVGRFGAFRGPSSFRPPYRQTGYSAPRPTFRPPPQVRPTYRPPGYNNLAQRPVQSQYPCPLCLQAGKPESVARSHSYSDCQNTQPRNQPRRSPNQPAMRLVMVPDHDQQEYPQDHLAPLPEYGCDWSDQPVHQYTHEQPYTEHSATAYGPPPPFGNPTYNYESGVSSWQDNQPQIPL